MSKKRSDWYLPQEVLGLLSTIFMMPAIAVIAILTALFLPPITSSNVTYLFWLGLVTGIFGIILLFFARLPLYRQRRFFAFGPRELDRFHRRLYWLAYLAVLVSVGLLAAIWLIFR